MYIKTINEFIYDAENDLKGSILRVLYENRSSHDNDAEIQSWKESLPALAGIFKQLPGTVRENCEIVLEARYRIEEKRADAVLVGKHDDRIVIIIIENKRWSEISRYRPVGECSVLDPFHGGMTDHPSRQAAHYKTTLEYTNRYVQDERIKIYTMVYMQNALLSEKESQEGPFDARYRKLYSASPMYTGEEENEIIKYISERINGGEPGTAWKVYSSEVRYSKEYERLLGNLFGNKEELRRILDDHQAALFDEIRSEVLKKSKEKKLFLVEGKRGTGKTFVAVALLAYLYQDPRSSGQCVRYVEKNRDPRRTLQSEMKVPYQAMLWSLVRQNIPYDCLICDESHRMLKTVLKGSDERDFIERFLELSRVSVFFYDEKQSVHIDDYVTKKRILETARRIGIAEENIIERKLVYQHRCHAADRFLDTVDRLLDHPEHGLEDIVPFQEDEYEVALVNDPEELFRIIREKNAGRGSAHSSRVLAGKGRSFGEDWIWTYDNKDYGGCKSIAPRRSSKEKLYTWNFGKYPQNKTFASDEASVDLAGCIDTSQGLDFEYVGVIIAPDLIFDPESQRVRVCITGHQLSDPNTGRKEVLSYDPGRIEEVIRNTYRVLLSRGEKGCFIYCCDEALQQYLSQIIPMKRSGSAE